MHIKDLCLLQQQYKIKLTFKKLLFSKRKFIYLVIQGYVTGGKDGKVILWDPEFKKNIKTYELTNKNLASDSRGYFNNFFQFFQIIFIVVYIGQLTEEKTSIRAVTLTRRIVIGTHRGEICEIEKDGRIRVPIQGSKMI